MNQPEAAALIAMLATAFPNARFAEENAALYESAIGEFSADEGQVAIGELIHTSRYLPSIAEIRGEVFRQRRERQRLADASRRLAAPGDRRGTIGPPAAAWAPTLTLMLEQAAQYRRMVETWWGARGKPVPPDPGAPYLEIAKAGAAGEDVRDRFRRDVLHHDDQSELDRRYP